MGLRTFRFALSAGSLDHHTETAHLVPDLDLNIAATEIYNYLKEYLGWCCPV